MSRHIYDQPLYRDRHSHNLTRQTVFVFVAIAGAILFLKIIGAW